MSCALHKLIKYCLECGVDKRTAAGIDTLVASAPNGHHHAHPGWTDVLNINPGSYPPSRYQFFFGEDAGRIRVAALVRLRSARIFGYSLVEVLQGPVADSPELLLKSLLVLQEILAPMKPLALRVKPLWSGAGSKEVFQGLAEIGYRPMAGQPQTVKKLEIEIDRKPDELLLSFRRSARSNVRQALKLGVEVREDLDDDAVVMFEEMYQQKVIIQGAQKTPPGYWRAVRDYCRRWPQRGFFLSSWVGKDLVGGIVVFTVGRKAFYGGGGSRVGGPRMPKTHLLHFAAMQRARDRGYTVYNLGAVEGGVGHAGIGDHAQWTLIQRMNHFKRSFGGREVDFVSAHEKILRPVSYRTLWSLNRVLARACLRGNQH